MSVITETVVVNWLRYSKRIAVAGIIQWAVIALIVLAYVGISIFTKQPISSQIVEIVKQTVSSAATLAVSTTSAYYLHSAAEKYLKNRDGNG